MTISLRIIQTQHNTCGQCTLCCKVLGITDLTPEKPANEWCPHAMKSCGCKIYTIRPLTCRNFECIWLSHGMPKNLRPDKIHGVLGATNDGENLVLFEDPGYPGVASTHLKEFIKNFIEHKPKKYVVVICGKVRKVIGRPETIESIEIVEDPYVKGMTHIKIEEKV